jgi:serine protease Do
VPVIVLRDGRTETLAVTLGRREEAEAAVVPASSAKPEEPREVESLGMTLAPLNDELRARLGLDASAKGLAILAVDQASEAFAKGLREGEVITQVNQNDVTRLQDLEDRIAEAKAAGRKSVLIMVRRGGDPRFVALSIE